MLPAARPVTAVVADMRYLLHPEEFGGLQRMYRRIFYAHGYRRADQLIAISRTTAERLGAFHPEAITRTHVVYPGSDHVEAWPKPEKRGRRAIAFAHWANKRPLVAVDIWAELKRLIPGFDWKLDIVGAGKGTGDELRQRAAARGLSTSIDVHPFLPAEQFRQVFASSRLLIFPTTDEGFGFPLVEAMRLGIPVVTSDLPITREIGGPSLLYANLDSPRAFAEQCSRVICDEAFGRSLVSLAGLRSTRFSWQTAVHQIRGVLLQSLRCSTTEPT
jgi:glycosyltransferase involved in cell wall biosynthesis